MTATEIEKRLTLDRWTDALTLFRRRLRKCLRIVLASGVPASLIRQAALDVLEDLNASDLTTRGD